MTGGARTGAAICVAVIAVLTFADSALGGKSRAGIRSVSNPPLTAPARLALKVTGATAPVSVYASPGRRVVKGALRLVRHASVRHNRLSVKLPRQLRPGAWFIVVCPTAGRGSCAASRKPMVKLPGKVSAPVQANPVPETSHASTASIGSAGGTLSTTAADGTRFRLDIPAHSVPDGTQITMTPLSSLGVGGFSKKFVAGVQLAPEGLDLVHGGTLTILPSRAIPLTRQVAYGYNGTGDDVHQVPLSPKRAIVIPLAHFSGVGLLDAAAQALAGSGSAILDKYSALIAQELAADRYGYISDSDAFADCQALLQHALAELMQQEVPPGLNDDDAAQKAIRDLLTVARTSQLLGGSEGILEEELPTIHKLLEGIYNRAQDHCASNHDLSQIPKILDTDRTEVLFGFSGHDFSEDVKCLRFKLEFNSQISDSGGNFDGTFDLSTTSTATVASDANGLLTGQAPITYTAADGSKSQSFSCPDDNPSGWTDTQTIVGSTPSTLQVLKVNLPDLSQITKPNANLAVQLLIDPGQPQEIIDDERSPQCGEAASQRGPDFFWWGDFISTPLTSDASGTSAVGEPFGNDFATVFTIPLENFNPDIVHAVYNGSATGDSGNQVSEQVTIDVTHTPQG
jgi:hypothetical protein